MLKPARIFFYNFLMLFIPETSFFEFKRVLLRWCGAKVASGVRVCSSTRFFGNSELEIGEDTWIGQQCLVIASAKIIIGACVDIAPRVYIGTGTHEIDAEGAHSAGVGKNLPIIIEDGCWLGAGSIVLPSIVIGQKSVVAAGAVVVQDVKSLSIVAGAPAKTIKLLR